MDNESLDPPVKDKGDYAHAIIKTVVTSIPVVGGTAAEIFASTFARPIEKRREKWSELLIRKLIDLEDQIDGLTIENRSENEMFVTTVMHATQYALRTHQQEKIDCLSNAVLNSSLLNAPEEDLQLIFLNFIDELTLWHIRILKFFQNPKKWGELHGVKCQNWISGAPSTVLTNAFRDLENKSEFYTLIVRDLQTKGLMGNGEFLNTSMTVNGMFDGRTTEMGDDFLRYIESPLDTSL